MKLTLTKLSVGAFALTTAFGALLMFGQPVAASVQAEDAEASSAVTLHELAGLLQFADNDEDDDEGGSKWSRGGDDDEGCDDDEGDDDEGGCMNGGQMAPQGNVAPPDNGLFAPGAKPKAVIN